MLERLWAMAAGCVPDAYPWEIPHIARAGGFDSCGMWVDPEAGWDSVALAKTRRSLASSGVKLLDVEPLWLEKSKSFQMTVVSAGIELGARNVLVVSREPDMRRAQERFQVLCDFAGTEIRIVLEFGVFTEVKSLGDALIFIREVGHASAGVLIDQMHLNRSGERLPDLNDPLFPYVQACDFPASSASKEGSDYIIAALDERCPLGEGDASLADSEVIRNGEIDVSLEIRSKALRDEFPDAKERARQIFERCQNNL